ncbi:MAG: protein phosphatase 2C domain-containing protein [Kofleriaceae bacterium]
MDTINGIVGIAASVAGSRHLRTSRNGQDAAAVWCELGRGAIVVCDGCGSAPSSEVGARLAAKLVLAGLAARLRSGHRPSDLAMWTAIRRDVIAHLAQLAHAMPGELATIVHDHFLFTVVAAAVAGGEVAVWAAGDGGYAVGDRACMLGPFADNQPPYIGYELLGELVPTPIALDVASAECGSVLVATDGVTELGFDALDLDRAFAHPDGLRRQLSLLARSNEHIDWDNRRIVRTAARLQDDGAVAALRWCS